jgi:hypothetical protein
MNLEQARYDREGGSVKEGKGKEGGGGGAEQGLTFGSEPDAEQISKASSTVNPLEERTWTPGQEAVFIAWSENETRIGRAKDGRERCLNNFEKGNGTGAGGRPKLTELYEAMEEGTLLSDGGL